MYLLRLLIFASLFGTIECAGQRTTNVVSIYDTLAKHFKNPPPEYSLVPFWSLNNTLDSTRINWQIDQMLDKGVYGAFMHAREGLDQSATPYFSAGWWTAIEAAVKHAHEKGFYTHLYDEDKWPSGSAGGRTLQANPARNIKKVLRYNEFQVPGPQNIQLSFAENPVAIYAGKVSDRGVYDFSTQIDITAQAGKEWKAPAGKWSVIVFTETNDPEGQINYLDSATVSDFLHITHDEYYKRLGQYFGNTIPGVFFDEIYANARERKNTIFWSDDLLTQFRRIKGYDLKPYLSLLVLNDPRLSAAKRFDFFDVVRIVYGNAWFAQYAKWAADHHIWVTGHTTEELIQYIRQSDYFFTEGQLQVPCTDNEDFRYGFPRGIDFYDPKQMSSSLGHLYGKKRMAAEAMGGGGYTIPLEEYRYGFSMLGVYGVNSFIPHLFAYSMERPENQQDWPPSWFYQNPYWKYFKPLANYAQRVSYMLSQGKHSCRVALVYPLTQAWLGGYATGPSDEYYREVQRILIDGHIDFDVIDPYSISQASVSKNGLQAGDEEYKVIILPGLSAIQRDNMLKIQDFAARGGIVIGLRELPSASEKGTPTDPEITGAVIKIFGFQPRELGQMQYHTEDRDRTERVTLHTINGDGKGIFTRYATDLPDIIRKQITPDILITGEGNEWIKYQHRQTAGRDMYYFMNSRKLKGRYTVTLSQPGIPQLSDPETGNTVQISNYHIRNNRLEVELSFAPWESYFIVITPSANQKQMPVKTNEVEWRPASSLPAIRVQGNWDFQLTPSVLNDAWTSTPTKDTLALPVMKFKAAINGLWKEVKIEDPFTDLKGGARYLSTWDAAWISYYDNSMHLPEVGGGTVYFKKNFLLNQTTKNAVLDITGDAGYELFINGRSVGAKNNWREPTRYNIAEYLHNGTNEIRVKTSNTKGLLLQSAIQLQTGADVLITSDETWQASKDQLNWLPALRYAAPPQASWGNIAQPETALSFPCKVEYLQELPPGTETLIPPVIKGKYELYVNGQLIGFKDDHPVNILPYLNSGHNMLSVHVTLNTATDGLQKNLRLICGKIPIPLSPWSDHALGWYSGKAMYTKTIDVSPAYCKAGNQLQIDLGQVNHFAEIWVNDQLVTYRAWAPFIADITKFVHPGKNKITIVVANLLANEASWNVMDANIDNKEARWWNSGSIMREKEKLVSGLLGPVQLTPYTKVATLLKNTP